MKNIGLVTLQRFLQKLEKLPIGQRWKNLVKTVKYKNFDKNKEIHVTLATLHKFG